MVKRGTVKLKQSPMVLPAAHCAANGDNGTGVSNSNMIDPDIWTLSKSGRGGLKNQKLFFKI